MFNQIILVISASFLVHSSNDAKTLFDSGTGIEIYQRLIDDSAVTKIGKEENITYLSSNVQFLWSIAEKYPLANDSELYVTYMKNIKLMDKKWGNYSNVKFIIDRFNLINEANKINENIQQRIVTQFDLFLLKPRINGLETLQELHEKYMIKLTDYTSILASVNTDTCEQAQVGMIVKFLPKTDKWDLKQLLAVKHLTLDFVRDISIGEVEENHPSLEKLEKKVLQNMKEKANQIMFQCILMIRSVEHISDVVSILENEYSSFVQKINVQRQSIKSLNKTIVQNYLQTNEINNLIHLWIKETQQLTFDFREVAEMLILYKMQQAPEQAVIIGEIDEILETISAMIAGLHLPLLAEHFTPLVEAMQKLYEKL